MPVSVPVIKRSPLTYVQLNAEATKTGSAPADVNANEIVPSVENVPDVTVPPMPPQRSGSLMTNVPLNDVAICVPIVSAPVQSKTMPSDRSK